MIVTMQKRGTITISSAVRKQLDLAPGDNLRVEVNNGRLIMTPVDIVPRILTLTKSGITKEDDADKDIAAGRVKRFDSAKDLLFDLGEQ